MNRPEAVFAQFLTHKYTLLSTRFGPIKDLIAWSSLMSGNSRVGSQVAAAAAAANK